MKTMEHTMEKSTIRSYRLVLTALFTAFTTVATMVIRIPTPTMGYIHVGDCMVLLSGLFLGPVLGSFAAGLGSALADLFAGYLVWAPATFIIKALCAFLAYASYQQIKKVFSKNDIISDSVYLIFSGTLAELVMVAGYFLFDALLISFSSASFSKINLLAAFLTSATSIPANLIQGITGVFLCLILYPVLKKISGLSQH